MNGFNLDEFRERLWRDSHGIDRGRSDRKLGRLIEMQEHELRDMTELTIYKERHASSIQKRKKSTYYYAMAMGLFTR